MADSISQLTSRLKSLDGKIKRSNDMAKAAGEAFYSELQNNVNSSIGSIDDFAKGAANNIGRVNQPTVKSGVATVKWSGNQIHYLEFGTGLVGSGKYPDQAQMAEYGYESQPTGHHAGTWWILPAQYTTSEGKPVFTQGWTPYAPFYKTQLTARYGDLFTKPITDALTDLIERNL